MSKDHTYIGRSRRHGPSIWGNPFKANCYGREQAIAKYEDYLLSSGLLEKIEQLRGRKLVCHCAPLPCHGDVLIKYLNENIQLTLELYEQ